jgi:phosphoglycerate dehydrogenase-like enzyme
MGERLEVLTPFPDALLSRVGETLPHVHITTIPSDADPRPGVRGEVLLIPPWDPGNLAQVLERGIRWVHTIGTGVDRVPLQLIGDRLLTCSRGASGIPIAEWVLAVMLAHAKRLPEIFLEAEPAEWSAESLGGLYGARLGLVGLGGIGEAVARHALSFGMRVKAYRRSGAASPVEGVEVVRSLADVLGDADHVVLALPLTESTRNLIDATALAAIPDGAGIHLVNVSRGALVDQDALRVALDDGRIARASLDVTTPEPLPAGHWLYTHPRTRISNHVSWNMPGAFDLLLDTFIENLRRYRAGEPLTGRVDAAAGY